MRTFHRMAALSSAVLLACVTSAALAQPAPRGPGWHRPPPPPPRYYHHWDRPYYQAPVYAPPPVVYAPAPSPGINLVIPFHF